MELREIFNTAIQKMYPRNGTCYGCGCDVFNGEPFCKVCLKEMTGNYVFCVRCGRKIAQGGYCLDCKQQQPLFDKARSLFSYEGETITRIYAMKNGDPALCNAFADLAIPLVRSELSADLISFVPMSKKSRRLRGYNQSQLLAEALGRQLSLPVEDLFEKVRDTSEQKSLSRKERQQNLHGCYRLTRRALVRDKTVLLVDDVMTTGTTMEELTRLLKGASTKAVFVFTVASVSLQK